MLSSLPFCSTPLFPCLFYLFNFFLLLLQFFFFFFYTYSLISTLPPFYAAIFLPVPCLSLLSILLQFLTIFCFTISFSCFVFTLISSSFSSSCCHSSFLFYALISLLLVLLQLLPMLCFSSSVSFLYILFYFFLSLLFMLPFFLFVSRLSVMSVSLCLFTIFCFSTSFSYFLFTLFSSSLSSSCCHSSFPFHAFLCFLYHFSFLYFASLVLFLFPFSYLICFSFSSSPLFLAQGMLLLHSEPTIPSHTQKVYRFHLSILTFTAVKTFSYCSLTRKLLRIPYYTSSFLCVKYTKKVCRIHLLLLCLYYHFSCCFFSLGLFYIPFNAL